MQKQEEIDRQRRDQEEKKKAEDALALERSKESKTGEPWQLEEDHCLSQAVKKFPVFLPFHNYPLGRLSQSLDQNR